MSLNNTLSFFGQQLKLDTEEQISKVIDQIRAHKNLEVLDFRGNTLSVLAGKRIAEAIQTRSELKECIWSDMFTGRLKDEIPLVLDALGEALTSSRCRLTTLDLSDNAFGAGLSESLFNFLQSPALYSLENLILNNNGLGLAGEVVGKALCQLHEASIKAGTPLRLKKFICGRNRLEVTSTIALTNAFFMIRSLEEIRLPQNGIHEPAIEALAEAFLANADTLRIIDINDNLCGVAGAMEISERLPQLKKLEVLDLGDCVCDDGGVLAILDGLDCRRDCLQKVVLSGNNLTSDIVDEIGCFFSSASMCHVQVDISVNMFGEEFDRAKAQYGTNTNIDFGRRGDDELLSSDDEEQGAEDASMEEDAFNTSRETVIDRSHVEIAGDDMLDELVNKGFGCMKIVEEKDKCTGGVVSFLDQSLKLDTAASAEPVVKAINAATTMKTLELRGNTLGIDAGKRIAEEFILKESIDRIEQLDIDFESRFQEDTAKVILNLAVPLKNCGMSQAVMLRAVSVAENIVRRVAAVKRNPIPATTQLINNIVAQCSGTGVKPETDWGINEDPRVIGALLRELITRGHLQHETALIARFFPVSFIGFQ